MVEESILVVTVCTDPSFIVRRSGFNFDRFGSKKIEAARRFCEKMLSCSETSIDVCVNGVAKKYTLVAVRQPVDQRWFAGLQYFWKLNETLDCKRSFKFSEGLWVRIYCSLGNEHQPVIEHLNATAESVFKELVREYEVNEGF